MDVEVKALNSWRELDRPVFTRMEELRRAANDVWEDHKKAARFICLPHAELEDKSPLVLSASSPQGHEQVLELVNAIKFGIYL